MRPPASPQVPRWVRLRPGDTLDWLLIILAGMGVLLTGAALALGDGLGSASGAATIMVVILARLHGSTPAFVFLAAAVYLTRRGRTIGASRRWVWGGLLVTLPLWFLLGMPISVRGLGDITWLLLMLNLVGAGLMAVGVRRTLGAASR